MTCARREKNHYWSTAPVASTRSPNFRTDTEYIQGLHTTRTSSFEIRTLLQYCPLLQARLHSGGIRWGDGLSHLQWLQMVRTVVKTSMKSLDFRAASWQRRLAPSASFPSSNLFRTDVVTSWHRWRLHGSTLVGANAYLSSHLPRLRKAVPL